VRNLYSARCILVVVLLAVLAAITYAATTKDSSGFYFNWTVSPNVPTDVQRTTSLAEVGWSNIAVGITSGEFTDTNPPADKAFYRTVLSAAPTPTPTPMPTPAWYQSTGTENKNMQALMFKDGSTFAGGATGVYVSSNSAASFEASNTGNDNTGPTRGFASNPRYLFTCTSQGVYRSTNNGATWIQKTNGLGNLLTSGIHYLDPCLFVVTPTGVFRSTNDGDNWQSAGMASIDVRSVTSIDTTVFVGTVNAGVYKSTGLGTNWFAANSGMTTTPIRAIQSKGTTLFAGGGIGSGVYRSTNYGGSWTLLAATTGLPSSSYRGFASDGDFIFAASFGSGVYYSSNNGDSWTAINTGLPDLTIYDLEVNDTMLVAATATEGVFRYPLANLPRK